MKYYAQINSHNILVGIDLGTLIEDEYGSSDVQNIEVSKEYYDNYQLYGSDYYIYDNGEIVVNPEYETTKLNEAKQAKYDEANEKAREYLESGEALYEFEEGKHIEATDGNIAKIGLKSTALILAQDFTTTFPWNTKEDENIFLNALTGKEVAEGLGVIQDEVWTVKFPNYLTQIDNAETVEEVEAIEINYNSNMEEENEIT